MPWWGWLALALACVGGVALIAWGGIMEQRHCLAELGHPSTVDDDLERGGAS